MDFAILRDIEKMFARRWDVFVVACLSEQKPLRFSQLAHVVSEHSRTRIADSTLNRVKDRLIRAGLVVQGAHDDGHPTYSLTGAGETQARFIRALTEAVNGVSDIERDDDRERVDGKDASADGGFPPRTA
ncbi:hypothetical protein [Micromonospora sp. WMMD1082]|uniref:hypothetical protein n=1 Tax=Micromonospora sp. WMMD1082 TaxID=3016104 RepID=UPI002417D85A|nr:hypothetical protein [Micromonospora sp. WMMD1082]MDG4795443.1 hypothetical protein [Micromonospora sp. WMMD1082]